MKKPSPVLTGLKHAVSPKPFDAAKYPHRDFRGEKVVNGKKVRV